MLPTELRSLLNKYLDNEISRDEFERLWKSVVDDELGEEWHLAIESAIKERTVTGFWSSKHASRALAGVKAKIAADEASKTSPLRALIQSPAFRAAAIV